VRTGVGSGVLETVLVDLDFDVRSTVVAGFVAAHGVLAARDIARSRRGFVVGSALSLAFPFAFGFAVGRLGLSGFFF
jgi:hypothetical protein